MNLLPIATPAAPANAAGSEDPATTGSGDFTALLAMLVGAASTTLPIDTPSSSFGDMVGSDDLSLPAPLPAPVGSVPARDPAAPAELGTPIAPEAGTASGPIPRVLAASLAEPPVGPLGDVPFAPVGPSVAAGAAQSAPTAEESRPQRDVAPLAQPAVRAQPAQPAVAAQPGVPVEPGVPAEPAVPMQPAVPAEPAVAAQPGVRAEPAVATQPGVRAEPAVPAQPAVAAQSGVRAEPGVPAQPSGRAVPAQPAEPGGRMHGAEPAAPGEAASPTPPAPAPEEHERRPETMTLPEAAPFERPPLGNPPSAGHDRARDHDLKGSHGSVTTVPALDRPPVESRASDHIEGGSPPKSAGPAVSASPSGAPTQVVPLVAANRSHTLAPVDAPPAPPAAPATVPEQIVSAVVPLHGRGDGRHEVTLELRPDNLGTILVEVSVEHQTVHLTLHAAEPATSRLLSAALPDLRSALADAGLTAGQVGVGLDGGGGPGRRRHSTEGGDGDLRRSGGAGLRGVPAVDEGSPVRTLRPAAAGRLDLFL